MEFDAHRATVVVRQNVASLGLATFTQMINTVNSAPLWGLPARHVKLSNVPWEKKYEGSCDAYYTRSLEFDIDFNGFDREVPDVSRKALGRWDHGTASTPKDPPEWDNQSLDKTDILNYTAYKDVKGNPGEAWLDANGEPVTDVADVNKIEIEYYPESNFLQLGIPTSL
jgi:hypothetical protein